MSIEVHCLGNKKLLTQVEHLTLLKHTWGQGHETFCTSLLLASAKTAYLGTYLGN